MPTDITINQLLVLMKTVRQRLHGLTTLRDKVSTRDTYMYGDQSKKIIEPQYDVKAVDKKVVELENFLFMADSTIKTSNAVTKVELNINMDSLLAGLA